MLTTEAIETLLRNADPQTIAAAEDWYEDARATIGSIGRKYGLTLNDAAATAAVLSRRTQWRANLDALAAVAQGRTPTRTYAKNVRAARRTMLYGEHVLDVWPNAAKCAPFFDAIMGDPDAVVVDVHVRRLLGLTQAHPAAIRRAQDAITAAAHACGLTPRTAQATLWIMARNGRTH